MIIKIKCPFTQKTMKTSSRLIQSLGIHQDMANIVSTTMVKKRTMVRGNLLINNKKRGCSKRAAFLIYQAADFIW